MNLFSYFKLYRLSETFKIDIHIFSHVIFLFHLKGCVVYCSNIRLHITVAKYHPENTNNFIVKKFLCMCLKLRRNQSDISHQILVLFSFNMYL